VRWRYGTGVYRFGADDPLKSTTSITVAPLFRHEPIRELKRRSHG
jgi:hypothetical protein